MKQYKAPSGSRIIGTLERLLGRAELSGIYDDGTPEYQGRTEIFWEAGGTVTKDGKIVFLDEDGAEWTFDQLEKIDG
jgi:hypothetical protein